MRLSIIVAALLASSAALADTPAAPPLAMPITQGDATDWSNASGALDQCVSGLQLRGDTTMCRALSTFLNGFAARVHAAATPPPVTPTPAPDDKAPTK